MQCIYCDSNDTVYHDGGNDCNSDSWTEYYCKSCHQYFKVYDNEL